VPGISTAFEAGNSVAEAAYFVYLPGRYRSAPGSMMFPTDESQGVIEGHRHAERWLECIGPTFAKKAETAQPRLKQIDWWPEFCDRRH